MAPQMIMAVIPNNRTDSYHAIKKTLCIERPIPSQVMTGTVLKKPKGMMSVATKVAVQMATKLGAEPWAVGMPIKGKRDHSLHFIMQTSKAVRNHL